MRSLFVLPLLVLSSHCIAKDLSSVPAQSSALPTIVRVGMYINRIEKVDVKNQTFDCELYLWLTWKGKVSPLEYEFINGSNIIKQFEAVEVDSSGDSSYSVKISGTFHTDLDVSRYPRDTQNLTIELEDFSHGEDSLRYSVDNAEISNDSIPISGGWRISKATETVKGEFFEVTGKTYSDYETTVTIDRVVTPFIIKVFVPLIIVVAMSMLTFFLPATELAAQLGIGTVSLLSIIALHLQVADKLPDVGYFTTADILMMGSYVFIFLALVETVVANVLCHRRKIGAPSLLDRICRWVFPLGYFFFILTIVLI